jgi:hypothetical protein
VGDQEEYAEGKISQINEEGRRKKEEGRRNKEEAIKSYISEIKNFLIVGAVAMRSKISAFICVYLRFKSIAILTCFNNIPNSSAET